MGNKNAPPSTIQPLLLLLLILCSVTPFSVAGAGRGRRQLGFFYTRTRGRCTPQYWSGIREHWPRMVPPASTVWKAFGSRAVELRYGSGLTLLESTVGDSGEGDSFRRLLKQGTAALLNSYGRKGYPYRAWEVKSLVIQATVSAEAAAAQARVFAAANEACD
ncbi:uncharacterized protein LOC116206188 [Punica granatum]|uniref:Uncharacterized protein n=2 Tax=Punica granatum TaxID=22663 RepID=A0A2I0L2E6_PUNGR|nr:uncharacterized protein LOC116206188 [Punica granatum]PKI74336.1 hypothetical protein CRG98_005216 [Punica granatum]